MRHTVVCISSEDGAGAQDAALIVAKELGYRVINEDIVMRAALEAGVERDVVADIEKRKSRLLRIIEGLGPAGLAAGYVPAEATLAFNQVPSDDLRSLIRTVIEETASTGSAVIVAHAASHALADRQDVLRVLVTASPATRVSRVAATANIDEKEAARIVKKGDAGRADYIQRFYGVSAELPTHYDIVINTDKLDPQEAARLIVQATLGGDS
jgi:cytidylate kinase